MRDESQKAKSQKTKSQKTKKTARDNYASTTISARLATMTIGENNENEVVKRAYDPIDTLKSFHTRKELVVEVDKAIFLHDEIKLTSNLEIKGIKTSSDAIFHLLIEDQILSINGKVPNNPEQLLNMTTECVQNILSIALTRQANKNPPTPARLSFKDGDAIFQRKNGSQYFVVKLHKVPGVHMGFRAKSYGGRIIVTDVQENGIAYLNFAVGDTILDLNAEPVTDVDSFHKNLRISMKQNQSCTTLVERPVSFMEVSNAKVIIDVLAISKLDPPLAKDAAAIGQREAERYTAKMHRKRKALRSALKKKKSNKESPSKSRRKRSLVNV
ncbi:PDZ domain containing protein [Ditylenchus destructor]|uniref:PDZ domain containing protein n=1 Tax=Ditylenchus destructor TaxID=166010 RepID=A0AAD4NCP9_9BILA|nr:PDZ domain containing protein [Ditylenchus destructor]